MQNKYRQAVLAIIKNKENKFLIGKSPRDGDYKLPQGGCDNDIPEVAIKREMSEELGLKIDDNNIKEKLPFTVIYHFPEGSPMFPYTGQEMTVFVIELRNDQIPKPQDEEFEKLEWISLNEFYNYETSHRRDAYFKALEYVFKN